MIKLVMCLHRHPEKTRPFLPKERSDHAGKEICAIPYGEYAAE
jgi:hypothetical protein